MNTKLKIAIGVAAGVVAGTTLLGTAFATSFASRTPSSYGMMRSFARAANQQPKLSDMLSFMERYRTPDGRIDVDRMHADMASGKAAGHCGGGASSKAPGRSPSGTVPPQGSGMMGGWY